MVVSSTYLRLLMFLPPVLIPACNSSSQAFLIDVLSIYIKQTGWQEAALLYSFLNLESISCSIWGSNCCFLTHIQVSQETDKMVWNSCLSKSFPQFVMIYLVKGYSIVDETEIDVFVKFPHLFYNPANAGNLISSSSSSYKPTLDIWSFLVCIRPQPACKLLSNTLLAWEMSVTVSWLAHSLVLPFLGIGVRIHLFRSCGHF